MTVAESLVTEKIEKMSPVTESVNDEKAKSESKPKKKVKKQSPSHVAGVTAAGITFTLGRLIGGEEASPRKDLDEERTMVEAYTKFFEYYDITDVPPGIALCTVVGVYGLRVMTLPPSKTKFERFRGWLGSFFKRNKPKQVIIKSE